MYVHELFRLNALLKTVIIYSDPYKTLVLDTNKMPGVTK